MCESEEQARKQARIAVGVTEGSNLEGFGVGEAWQQAKQELDAAVADEAIKGDNRVNAAVCLFAIIVGYVYVQA